jgi:uracil-DNA glycosylase family 4
VGEALGANEVRYQRPFVGEAGEVLDKMLSAAGIIRNQCYITNVFDFHPERNDISPYFSVANTKVKLSPVWHSALDRLRAELAECTANIFIALGQTAAYALAEVVGITKWRGSIVESTLLPGRKVLCALHPASTLRFSSPKTWAHMLALDIKKAAAHANFPELRHPEYNFKLNPNYHDVIAFLNEALCSPQVGIDIEVAYLMKTPEAELSHFGVSLPNNDVMCIPFINGCEPYFPLWQEAEIMRLIARLCSSEAVLKIGQNIIFDTSFLLHRYNILWNNLADTMIAQALIASDMPKGLDFLTSVYTNQPYYKDDGKKQMRRVNDHLAFQRYNALDAVVLHEIFAKQKAVMHDIPNMWEYYQHKIRLIKPLLFMQKFGIKMDLQRIAELKQKVEADMQAAEAEFKQLAGDPDININSSKQLKTFFYIERGYHPYKKRGGGITTDEDALKRLAGQQKSKEAAVLLRYRKLNKQYSTYLTTVLDEDNRMRGLLDPVGAGSRISSKKTIFNTGGNMQNQPPMMKRCMVADDGYFIFNIDLSQAENRVVAYVWNVQTMMAAFKAGRDIHRQTAALIFNKGVDEISSEKGSTTIGNGKYSERDIGKRANHALNYGMGAGLLALNMEISQAEAKQIRDKYFASYPEIIMNGHKRIEEQFKHKSRWLEDLYGRRRNFIGPVNDELLKAAYSYIAQSTVGNHMNICGVEFCYYTPLLSEIIMLNQVHDSLVGQIKLNTPVEQIAKMFSILLNSLERPLTSPFGVEFVLPCDLTIGINCANASEKNPFGQHEVKLGDRSPEALCLQLAPLLKELRHVEDV